VHIEMAKLSKDLVSGTLHPRETLFLSGNFGALNAETIVAADGAATVSVDLRGTFNLTVTVEATIDGTNWQMVPMRPLNGAATGYVAAIVGNTAGSWTGSLAGFRLVRARCTAYTSGAAVCVIATNSAPLDQSLVGTVTTSLATTLGAVGVASTLNLGAPGVGLRHYLTSLSITRYATALLTASATPITVTTNNLPGALAYTFAADAAALGVADKWREEFAFPLAAAAQNAVTSIACPAVPSVIWRITAGFYVAP
jgi:hypothetical protein